MIKVVSSSSLGKQVFGFAVDQVLANMVKKALQADIDELLKKPKVSAKDLAASKKTALLGVQRRPGMDKLVEKRDIIIEYRSIAFSIKVSNLSEEVDFRFAAALKTVAVDAGDLQTIVCENDLVGRRSKVSKGQMDKSVVMEWQAARDSCNDMLSASGTSEGEAIVSRLGKKEQSLRAIDSTFLVEIRFVQSMAGEAGEKLLKQKRSSRCCRRRRSSRPRPAS